MTELDYQTRLVDLRRNYNDEVNRLHVKYANENNPYKVGDIIQDDRGTIIKITNWKIDLGFDRRLPVCVYIGKQLKKDLTPFKRNTEEAIYQTRITQQY
jgi:hypothetical protein